MYQLLIFCIVFQDLSQLSPHHLRVASSLLSLKSSVLFHFHQFHDLLCLIQSYFCTYSMSQPQHPVLPYSLSSPFLIYFHLFFHHRNLFPYSFSSSFCDVFVPLVSQTRLHCADFATFPRSPDSGIVSLRYQPYEF